MTSAWTVTNSMLFRGKIHHGGGRVPLSPFPTPLDEYDHVMSIYAELYVDEQSKMSACACAHVCIVSHRTC